MSVKRLPFIYLITYQAIIHKMVNALIVFLRFALSFYFSLFIMMTLKIADDKYRVLRINLQESTPDSLIMLKICLTTLNAYHCTVLISCQVEIDKIIVVHNNTTVSLWAQQENNVHR